MAGGGSSSGLRAESEVGPVPATSNVGLMHKMFKTPKSRDSCHGNRAFGKIDTSLCGEVRSRGDWPIESGPAQGGREGGRGML